MIVKNNTSKIMELFFKYPERKFHLRELERLTKLSLPAVKMITERLEKEKLLKSEKEKMVKNFYATRNSKFINLKRSYNLNSIFSSGLLNFLNDKYEEPEAIILFGSYSKGEDSSKSDIDIAVITPSQKKVNLSIFEKRLERKINVYEIQLKKAEKEFVNSLANGIVLSGNLNL